MNDQQINILEIGLVVPLVVYILIYLRSRFRSSIKVGDVVGVDFGEEVVLNRTVREIRRDGTIIVRAKDGDYDKAVELKDIYMKCSYSKTDEIVEED
jgi:hypothetical protein